MTRRPSRSVLIGIWLSAVLVLAIVLGWSRWSMTGGDDPDTARQRPGILDIGELPIAAPETYGAPAGRPLTIFTGRRLHLAVGVFRGAGALSCC